MSLAYFGSERVNISSVFAHQAGNVPSCTDINRFAVVVVGFTFFETNEVDFFFSTEKPGERFPWSHYQVPRSNDGKPATGM